MQGGQGRQDLVKTGNVEGRPRDLRVPVARVVLRVGVEVRELRGARQEEGLLAEHLDEEVLAQVVVRRALEALPWSGGGSVFVSDDVCAWALARATATSW